jgi:EthD domain
VIKLVVLLKRKAGVSQEEFRAYYEQYHAPLGMKFSGKYFSDYRRTYPVTPRFARSPYRPEGTGPHEFEWDAITEIWFKDQDTLDAYYRNHARPEVHGPLVEDSQKFIDLAASHTLVCEEERSAMGFPLTPVL